MDGKINKRLALDLQLFAEGEDANKSVETTNVDTTTTGNPPVEEKIFTQADFDYHMKSRLGKREKQLFAKIGIENEEELDAFVEKLKNNGVKNYMSLIDDHIALKSSVEGKDTEIASLKAEKTKSSYLRVIEKANVDDEFIEFVYSKVEPKEKETMEDYKARVDEYISAHKNVLNTPITTINTSVDLSGSSKPKDPETLGEALKEKYKRGN